MIFRTIRYSPAENERVIFAFISHRLLTIRQSTEFQEAIQLLGRFYLYRLDTDIDFT